MADCTLTQDNTGKNLTDCDFSGKDLSGYVFKSCTLTGTNFSGCTFDASTDFTNAFFGKSSSNTPTNFSGCDLTAAKFRVPANFGGMATRDVPTNLTNTKLSWSLLGKQMQYVDITGAVFTDILTDLSMCQLTSVRWKNFDFTGKTLKNTHFNNCDLTGCIMTGVVLDYVSFVQVTNLTNVKMNTCSLYHTVFDGSTMTNTNLSYATKIANCSFLNTLLKGTIFDGNDLTTSQFGIPDLTSTDPAYITSFQFATLTADFMITNLQKKWQCADFRNVIIKDFSTITNQLYNVQAYNSLFNNTLNFTNAKLNGSNFNNATFNGVSFNNSFINNASLVGATTAQGNELGRRGAIFIVSQSNASLSAPYDYDSFLNDLTQISTDTITNVFAHFGYTVGKITCSSGKDPVSQNAAWTVTDQQTQPNRTYMVVNSPISQSSQFELLVYDNSPSSFSYAFMIGSGMEDINFSNAKMDHTQLYGATITYANLSNADFTGAQLGKNSSVFSIAQSDTTIAPPYDYTSFLTALKGPDLSKITDLFQHYGYTVASISCTVSRTPPSGATAAWSIVDNQLTPARNFTVAQINTELDVFFDNATPAALDYSYMSGIILTQANLTGCTAVGCHLYNDQRTSSFATLNHTTLVGVRFDNANLYKADFTSAVVSGASFIGANLMGANFKGVTLDAATSGAVVNLNEANLQGADFSATVMKGADLLGAAICVPVSSTQIDQTFGVWLRTVKQTDNNLANYISELNNASASYTITSPPPSVVAKQLQPGTVSSGVKTWLQTAEVKVDSTSAVQIEHYENTWEITDDTKNYFLIPGYDSSFTVAYNVYLSGNPAVQCSIPYPYQLSAGTVPQSLIDLLKANSVSLSSSASLDMYQRANQWTIRDTVNNNMYTLWWGVQLLLGKLNNVIYVRSSFSYLPYFFSSFGITLRPQTFITKTIDTNLNKTIWMVDLGKEDAYYLNTGYVQLKAVGNSATASSITQLDIYGYTMRMQGLGNNQQEVIQDFDCEVTKITADVMDDQTLLPNNYTKIQNTNLNNPFNLWVQVYRGYPSPPACVPTGISFCQRPTLSEATKKLLTTKKPGK